MGSICVFISVIPLFFALGLELLGLVKGDQSVKQFVQIAVEDGFNLIQCQTDAVIRHPALGIVVGADPLASVTGAHLELPLRSDLFILLALGLFIKPGAQGSSWLYPYS